MAASTTSPDSGFTPRKEFIRQQKVTSNTFALLAVAQTSFIRFYSFPPSVIVSLRRLFENRSILAAFRQDGTHNLCEFTLEGKPWANTKSVATEKLLIDIIAIIYHCGYTFLSSLDYGRESDDRLAMAFSKLELSLPGSRSGTPLPPSASPLPDGSGSQSSDRSRSSRIPFAISFASTTLMRVIAPPLHLTPAILQAVRGSWPRGVVSEKKVGDNSFEFKLKGYRCRSFLFRILSSADLSFRVPAGHICDRFLTPYPYTSFIARLTILYAPLLYFSEPESFSGKRSVDIHWSRFVVNR